MPSNLKFSKKGLVILALLLSLGLLIAGCADDGDDNTPVPSDNDTVVPNDNDTVAVTLDRPPSPESVFTF